MPTELKVEKIEDLSRKLSEAQSIYLADYTGLNVAAATELRRSLRQADVNYEVVKNRLAKLAVEKVGLQQLGEYLNGPTAMAFGLGDPIEPARILQKFIDAFEKNPQIVAYMARSDYIDRPINSTWASFT